MKRPLSPIIKLILFLLLIAFLTGVRLVVHRLRPMDVSVDLDPTSVSVGYIGCSNTIQTVLGYYQVGGKRLWPPDMRYDAGGVSDWAKDTSAKNPYWAAFDDLLRQFPNTDRVWWELCIREEEAMPYEEAVRVLEAIRAHIPNVVVYVTALPPYTQGICRITGTAGIERAAALRDELVAGNDDVVAGPELGPMTPSDTTDDGCHLSDAGLKTLGAQMKDFFDQ